MARVTRRKFLKVSGAGAIAAKTGGMAAILATGQGARLRASNNRALDPLERLRSRIRPAAAQGSAARGREGAWHQDQFRDCERQRSAAAHHVRDPVGRRARPVHAVQQSPASVCGERGRHGRCRQTKIGKAHGGYYPLSTANCNVGGKWISMPYCIVGGMIAYRKSWFAEIGFDKFPETWEQYHDAGKKLKAKGRPDRPDARPHLRRRPHLHLSADVVVRRLGGRQVAARSPSTARKPSSPSSS